MPIYVVPDPNLDYVLIYRIVQPWTWDELMLAFGEEIKYSQTIPVDARYNVIADVRGASLWGTGLRPQHFKIMGRMNPENWNSLTIVYADELPIPFRTLLNTVGNRLSEKAFHTTCFEDAYTLIVSQRQG